MRSLAWQVLVVGMAGFAVAGCIEGFDPTRCDDGSYKGDHVDGDCEKPEKGEEE